MPFSHRSARNLATLLLSAAGLLAGAQASRAQSSPVPPAPVTAFDGSYVGMPTAEQQNRSPPCAKPQTAILDVQNGAARMRSSFDRRKGQVKADGSLMLNGVLVVGSQHIPGFVEGQFKDGRFEGVSRFPSVKCGYKWSLQKSQ
ncbi:MAG: hypothetical protein JSS43_14635 [Proteobacteria bacterium]|nr:hypothetical protein [Pseudomonadota bacterium]